jgi:oligoendopeptidase F
MTGWHRKQHIFRYPFYYIEYGLAQLGSVQVWSNALQDQAGAVRAYRQALALGGTVSLPALYAAAGARLAFDAATLREAVALIEEKLQRLEADVE